MRVLLLILTIAFSACTLRPAKIVIFENVEADCAPVGSINPMPDVTKRQETLENLGIEVKKHTATSSE